MSKVYILSDARQSIADPSASFKKKFSLAGNFLLPEGAGVNRWPARQWRRSQGVRYHWLLNASRLCPVHGSRWWTRREGVGVVEHPTREEARAWCLDRSGWEVVEAVTLRVLERPQRVEQLELFGT